VLCFSDSYGMTAVPSWWIQLPIACGATQHVDQAMREPHGCPSIPSTRVEVSMNAAYSLPVRRSTARICVLSRALHARIPLDITGESAQASTGSERGNP
jgi:hypothetical protein